MNILVIGNGFDIAHGLKTSYYDFITQIKSIKNDSYDFVQLNKDFEYDKANDQEIRQKFEELKKITYSNLFLNHFIRSEEIENNSWCGIEDEIERVINAWISILNVIDERGFFTDCNKENEFIIKSFSSVLDKIFSDTTSKSGTVTYHLHEVDQRGRIKSSLFDRLRREFDGMIRAFELYLELFVETKQPQKCFDMTKIHPKLIVDFNYTSTSKIYDDIETKFIHGKTGSNNMVMGMNVYGEDYDKRFVYFMKFFQRIQHKNDILKVNDLIELVDTRELEWPINKKPRSLQNVYFIGHSMSNADGDIIRLLKSSVIDYENFQIESRFIIYCYNQGDYEQKVINLFEVFGKDKTIQMIYDKEIIFKALDTIKLK
ncbi:MAG: hypothetical protein H6Q69_1553 [Firmicutes bacterium]|nr:hypothetical protein [Bacillota bacterium]